MTRFIDLIITNFIHFIACFKPKIPANKTASVLEWYDRHKSLQYLVQTAMKKSFRVIDAAFTHSLSLVIHLNKLIICYFDLT